MMMEVQLHNVKNTTRGILLRLKSYKSRFLCIGLMILCASGTAFSQVQPIVSDEVSETQPTHKTGRIRGVIKDKDTGEPVPFSNVVAFQKGIQKKGTVTDFDGAYIISGLRPGKYDLKIQFVGYQPKMIKDIAVGSGASVRVNEQLQLNPNEIEVVEVVVHKEPLIRDGGIFGAAISGEDLKAQGSRNVNDVVCLVGGTVHTEGDVQGIKGCYRIEGTENRGKITDRETKEPIPFAMVIFSQSGFVRKGVVTDFEGNYEVTGLNPGKYDVTFQHVTYFSQEVKEVVVSEGIVHFLDQSLEPKVSEIEVIEVVADNSIIHGCGSKSDCGISSSRSVDTVDVDSVTTVEEDMSDLIDLILYPNPTTNFAFVKGLPDRSEIKSISAQILDINGRLIAEPDLKGTNRIDFSSLPNGMYVVRMNLNDQRFAHRITVAH